MIRTTLAALAASFVSVATPYPATPPAPAGEVLERVVLVVRHGVRSPTQTPQALEASTGRPWPTWPVAAGELTDHGALALMRMGQRLRQVYAEAGLLPASGCAAPGAVQVWADGDDSRTRRSGEVLAQALAPRCGVVSGHGAAGEVDPLFDGASPGVCPIPPDPARQAVQARADAEGGLVRPQDAKALQALQDIVAPAGCGASGGLCLTGGTTLAAGKKGVKLDGGLGLGATLSENLLLEYAEGFPASEVGWGRGGTEAAIAAVLPAHERSADLMRRTPYIALRNGSVMARTVVDLLDGHAPTDPHALPLRAGAKIVVIAGHDTNLSNLAGVFGLDWRFADQPDSTAPGTALAFEVWRGSGGERTVRVVVYAQTLRQLRAASPLTDADPPATAAPSVGACGPLKACTPAALRAAITARVQQACAVTPLATR